MMRLRIDSCSLWQTYKDFLSGLPHRRDHSQASYALWVLMHRNTIFGASWKAISYVNGYTSAPYMGYVNCVQQLKYNGLLMHKSQMSATRPVCAIYVYIWVS